MSSDPISPKTAQFIRTYIGSLGLLEILLMLRERPQSRFTPGEVSGQLRSTLEAVEQRLENLVSSGFVVRVEGPPVQYGFAPSTAEIAHMSDEIAGLYKNYRGRVIDIIYSPKDPMQSFSEAFRFKQDTDTNG